MPGYPRKQRVAGPRGANQGVKRYERPHSITAPTHCIIRTENQYFVPPADFRGGCMLSANLDLAVNQAFEFMAQNFQIDKLFPSLASIPPISPSTGCTPLTESR